MSGCTIITRGRLLHHGAACLLIALVLAPSAFAQQAPPSTLTPEAQEAVNKGILAAQQPDFLLALQYFQDAYKVAGNAPEVLYDLGLAESKIPGRELRAICWFAAYLAAAPGAPNAAAVQQQIDVLDVKSKSNLARLVKSVQDAAEKIPNRPSNLVLSDGGWVAEINRDRNFTDVAELWARAGNVSEAMHIGASLTDRDKLWLATRLTGPGLKLFKEAKSLLAGIKCDAATDPDVEIAGAAFDAASWGDAGDAREILQPCVANNWDTARTWVEVASTQFKQGDTDGARASLTLALNSTHRFNFGSDQYLSIACLQDRMGDFVDADKTFALARQYKYTGDHVEDVLRGIDRESARCDAVAHLELGDIDAARTAAAHIPPPSPGANDLGYDSLEYEIAKAQLIHGDRDAAQQTAALLITTAYRNSFSQAFESFPKDPDYFKPKPYHSNPTAAAKIWTDSILPRLDNPMFIDLSAYMKSWQPLTSNGNGQHFDALDQAQFMFKNLRRLCTSSATTA